MLAMTEETVRSWEQEAVAVAGSPSAARPRRAPQSRSWSGSQGAPALPVHLRRPSGRASSGIYLRRRVLAALVLTVLVLVAWVAVGELAGTAFGAPEPLRPMTPVVAATHVVQPGETFWSIARRLRPDGDARPLVDKLVRAHGGTDLQAGEVIVLPSTTGS